MDIKSVGSDRFIVFLNRSDMSELQITYEELDCSETETRRFLWLLLDLIRKNSGIDIDPSGNISIEAAPDKDGGCFLMFTVSGREKSRTVISKTGTSQIFEFESADSLLDAVNLLDKASVPRKIFTDGEKYRTEIDAKNASKLRRPLEEYGHFVGKDRMTLARTHEHWKELGN